MQIRKVLSGAIAVGLLASASAQAALTLPSDANGSSLFVTVFDTTNSESVTTNLGLFYSDFVDNTVLQGGIQPGAYTARTFNLDMTAFADNNPANILFNVYAGDALGGNGFKGVVITGSAVPSLTNGQMNGINTQAIDHIQVFNQNCGAATSCVGTFGDEDLWGSFIKGQFPAGSGVGFDQAAAFYQIVGANTPGSTVLTTSNLFSDASGNWNWMLTEAGQLTFSAPGGTPVPLPAAAWLLLSGLAGLGALGRRSSQKA